MSITSLIQQSIGLKPIPLFMLSSWIKAAAKCGFNVQPLFKEAGIQIDLVRLEEARVSPLQLISLLEQSVALSSEKYFPFVLGDTFAFESLPEFETLLTTSPSLRDALNAAKLAAKVTLPWLQIELKEEGDLARICLDFNLALPESLQSKLSLHLVLEGVLATVRKFGRSLQGSEDGFLGVEVPGADSEARRARFESFFQSKVTFEQPRYALVIEPRVLDVPLEGAFPSLHQQAQMLAEQRLDKEARRHGIAFELEEKISREPSLLELGMEDMAEKLGLHPRTLQRRLKDEGDSYLGVQARMRHRLACQWLRQGEQSIDEISIRLGFSDRRAFTSAFKRWEGDTPSAWRSKQ